MKHHSRRFALVLSLVGALACLAAPTVSRATSTVLPGWDLFETPAGGTTFMGIPFMGVPLGTFDFGGSIGVKSVGTTDTVVHRLGGATGPGPAGPIPIEMLALNLQSVVPVFGPDFAWITLQSTHAGPPTVGAISPIVFGPEGIPHGTFDSFFDVYFDVHVGSPFGPIALTDHLILSGSGNFWAHDAAPGALLIPDVNYLLDGSTTGEDFWIVGGLTESHPSAMHMVMPAAVPFGFSPGLGLLLASGLLSAGRWRRQRAQKV